MRGPLNRGWGPHFYGAQRESVVVELSYVATRVYKGLSCLRSLCQIVGGWVKFLFSGVGMK